MNKPREECKQRDVETLALLSNYCVLSTSAIRSLLEPQPSARQVERSIERLQKQRWVTTRRFRIGGGHANFHELVEDMRLRLKLKKVHTSHLDHNDYCALSLETIRRRFPEARFIFERSIPADPNATVVLGPAKNAIDALPDALMILPSAQGDKQRYIAIEIERFQKCTSRLLYKLGRYVSRTQLDGVLYLAPDPSVLRSVSKRYLKLLETKGSRIRHYQDYFLINALLPNKHRLSIDDAHTANGGPVSVWHWMRALKDLDTQNREASKFAF